MAYMLSKGMVIDIIYNDDRSASNLIVAMDFKVGDKYIIVKTNKNECWINTDHVAMIKYRMEPEVGLPPEYKPLLRGSRTPAALQHILNAEAEEGLGEPD